MEDVCCSNTSLRDEPLIHCLNLKSVLIVALANVSDEASMNEQESANKCRICVVEINNLSGYSFGETTFSKLEDMVIDGRAQCTGASMDDEGQ